MCCDGSRLRRQRTHLQARRDFAPRHRGDKVRGDYGYVATGVGLGMGGVRGTWYPSASPTLATANDAAVAAAPTRCPRRQRLPPRLRSACCCCCPLVLPALTAAAAANAPRLLRPTPPRVACTDCRCRRDCAAHARAHACCRRPQNTRCLPASWPGMTRYLWPRVAPPPVVSLP